MTFDIEKFLRIDISYPGISFGYESWALESYLKVLDESVSFAREQYRLRAKRDLDKREAELVHEQVNQKLWEIEEAAETQIPRFFRIGALIPIWGLFESFVFDIALYVGGREKTGLSLRDIRAPNFRRQVEMYFEGALRIKLPWSEEERFKLGLLQELRNFVAHRNGRVTDLNTERRQDIERLVAAVPSVTIDDGALMVPSEYIEEAAALVFNVVGKLSQMIADRYDGPTVPNIEI